MENNTRLILVGGFLGAGKTTLLWEAAERIMKQGKHIGLITNDQAPELVDTALLKQRNLKVAEVSGSCFCCNFNGLLSAIGQVKEEAKADIIIAEPVGSCTDLSATLLQPLKSKMKQHLLISPLTVMADPVPLTDILFGGTAGLHPDAAYIFEKQLEESDIILISKSDLLTTEEMDTLKRMVNQKYPHAEIRTVSALTGEGIEEWLEQVLQRTNSGLRIAGVDYDTYAKGEALMGWLNTTVELQGETINWDMFIEKLMLQLSRAFDRLKAPVGHVKALIESGEKFRIGNLTGKSDTLNFRSSAGISGKARLTLNARVQLSPEVLERITRQILNEQIDGGLKSHISAFRCLSPGRPNPTFRFDQVEI